MASIILVDDDAAVRTALTRILVDAGHEVRVGTSGGDAALHMRERPADLIVSDVYMPGMDGIEMLIRIQQEFPAIRLVIMSGGGHMGTKDILEDARNLGARVTLAKPVTPARLLNAVRTALA